MYKCPKMVDEYLQWSKDTVYDVVLLLATFDLKDTNQDVDHGKTTAVIRYKTHYIVQSRGTFIISFALGYDVS